MGAKTGIEKRGLLNSIPGKIEVESIGIGIMRSAGFYIGLLLQLEDPSDRHNVLADVMQELAMSPEEVADSFYRKMCLRCGMGNSPLHPCECDEKEIDGR